MKYFCFEKFVKKCPYQSITKEKQIKITHRPRQILAWLVRTKNIFFVSSF